MRLCGSALGSVQSVGNDIEMMLKGGITRQFHVVLRQYFPTTVH